jgi:hypothetical protein
VDDNGRIRPLKPSDLRNSLFSFTGKEDSPKTAKPALFPSLHAQWYIDHLAPCSFLQTDLAVDGTEKSTVLPRLFGLLLMTNHVGCKLF